MAEEIVMPRLSDSMEEGTILKWMKSVGDEVALGDELVEIETDKANMVFEADAAGTLIEITADEGATLPIGEVIARVGEAGEAGDGGGGGGAAQDPGAAQDEAKTGGGESHDGAAAQNETAARAGDEDTGWRSSPGAGSAASPSPRIPAARPPADAPAPSPPAQAAAGDVNTPKRAPAAAATRGDGQVKASPLARRLAQERGVELASLGGSGPGRRIMKADVERALAQAPPAPQGLPPHDRIAPGPSPTRAPLSAPAGGPGEPAPPSAAAARAPDSGKGRTEIVELTRTQQTIARRMAESKATVPHFYLQAEIDMSRAFGARRRLKAQAGDKEVVPSLSDIVIKACALALREHPRANGAYRDGRFGLYERVNVGLAVAADAALIVPTVFDADKKGLAQIATEARELARRVREGQITPPELSGATFTVSNLGMFGIQNFHPVINPPQAAILAVGEVTERPVIGPGEPASARLMGVTLACDHRILYGADAALFLARIRALLEEPEGLAL